jgi:tRNA-specific 2-thiouridylase
MSLKKKVFVGVSGGVDSSVSLALLKEQGYDVTGVFLKVWSPDFLPCDWREERRSAMRVCATLDVPFITLDCEAEYKKEVVDYMIAEYKNGRVPNPDIFCNKYVKFGVFLKKALELGADFVATGHYAKVEHGNEKSELFESNDKDKDQSYFLYTLGQKELSHSLFPIGHLTKPEVRSLARKFKLPTAEKKDSQGLCFIGRIDMKDFLTHFIKTEAGNVLNTSDEVIGAHDGAILYTIGQRHGFTITKKSSTEPRYFVVSKDLEKNTITVASKENEKDAVFSTKKIFIKDLHLISGNEVPQQIETRIRYRQEKQKSTLEKTSDGYTISFESPQNGVAVGQSAVLYLGDACLGGGIIEKTL